MKLSRRSLIGAGLTGAAASAFGISGIPIIPEHKPKQVKNIIFCVVDGMAMQTLSMADQLHQMIYGKQSYWAWLMEQDFAVNGLEETRSLSSIVTDSSAASSTWGSGRRIWNGQVNVFPDGTKLRTLTSLMSSAGVKCGLVTTTTMTHATPAGFAVNSMRRDDEPGIAEKYIDAGVSILMGGGDKNFSAEKRKDKKDVYTDYQKSGYKIAKSRDEVMGWRGDKLLGIFSDSHLPFTIDRNNDEALRKSVPTLAEMASIAINNLKDSPNGFLLQIEGGKVDHGGHANDVAAMLYDQLAFEDAVKVAVDFALKDGETLVIITSDHATGGPSLNGAGDEYFDSTAGLHSVMGMKATYGVIQNDLGKTPSDKLVQDVIENRLGFQLKSEEAAAITGALSNKYAFGLSEFQRSFSSTLAMVLGNHSKITWTSGNHTSEHVMLTAVGPGNGFAAGLTKNTTLFDIMLAAKGLKHSNPTMSFEDAKMHYEKLKESANADLVASHASPEELALWQ
ncbi:MAG: alkaline phosphatase [Fimbriimonadaceae bacterium]|nr:alkaline phosphatase [Fimbriimonadaceae bacterium]